MIGRRRLRPREGDVLRQLRSFFEFNADFKPVPVVAIVGWAPVEAALIQE